MGEALISWVPTFRFFPKECIFVKSELSPRKRKIYQAIGVVSFFLNLALMATFIGLEVELHSDLGTFLLVCLAVSFLVGVAFGSAARHNTSL